MDWVTAARSNGEFDYGDEQRAMWRSAVTFEQERCGIRFDLENDNGVETRVIGLEPEGDVERRVVAYLCLAGGDWEAPVGYFRCQLDVKSGGGRWRPELKFVAIPTRGNPNLVKGKKGMVARDAGDGDKIGDEDKRILWEEVERIAEERARDYDKALSDDHSKPEDSGAFRSLLVPFRRKASAANLKGILGQLSEMLRSNGHRPMEGYAYASVYEYVLENGVEFASSPLTADELKVLKGAIAGHRLAYKPKLCFYNAQHLAQRNRSCRYVEGFMMSRGIPIPIEHAWNSINGKVVDFTMVHANGGKPILGEVPEGWEYLGVELATRMITSLWSRRGQSVPLVSNYLDGFPLLKRRPDDKPPAGAKDEDEDEGDAASDDGGRQDEPAII